MRYLFYIVFGYLSGSVLYGYLLPKYLCHIDVTQCSEDQNPGTTNAFVHAGVPVGILVVAADVGKAFIPVFLAVKELDVQNIWFALVMAAPVVGHAFPFWRIRGGGKAIAASFGSLLGLYPRLEPLLILAFFYLLYSLIVVIRPHIYRSIVTYISFSVLSILLVPVRGVVFGCMGISVVVIWKHLVHFRKEKFSLCWGWRQSAQPAKK